MKGYTTGIDLIDHGFRGLKDGKLYCVCSSHYSECTDLISRAVVGLATNDISVVLFSIEKDRRTMFQNLLDIYCGLEEVENKYDDIERRYLILYEMGKLPLWIEGNAGLSYNSISDTIHRICLLNKHAIDSIFVDNIAKMNTDFIVLSSEDKINANLYLLKMVAKSLKIPIVGFCAEEDMSLHDLIERNEYVDKILKLKQKEIVIPSHINV